MVCKERFESREDEVWMECSLPAGHAGDHSGEEDYPTPCIHGDGRNLCPDCRHDQEADPAAWEEYGEHPAGIAAWAALRQEAFEAVKEKIASTPDHSNIPF